MTTGDNAADSTSSSYVHSMARPVSSNATLAWDQEGDLDQARAQIARRAEEQAAVRGSGDVMWLSVDDPATQVATLTEVAGDRSGEGQAENIGPVIVADLVLWSWTDGELNQLAELVRERGGLLLFTEPTAGLGWRRVAQQLGRKFFERRRGHHYRRDVPAELRALGLIVGTQVRLTHGWAGDYVRGEARHVPGRPKNPISE